MHSKWSTNSSCCYYCCYYYFPSTVHWSLQVLALVTIPSLPPTPHVNLIFQVWVWLETSSPLPPKVLSYYYCSHASMSSSQDGVVCGDLSATCTCDTGRWESVAAAVRSVKLAGLEETPESPAFSPCPTRTPAGPCAQPNHVQPGGGYIWLISP